VERTQRSFGIRLALIAGMRTRAEIGN